MVVSPPAHSPAAHVCAMSALFLSLSLFCFLFSFFKQQPVLTGWADLVWFKSSPGLGPECDLLLSVGQFRRWLALLSLSEVSKWSSIVYEDRK